MSNENKVDKNYQGCRNIKGYYDAETLALDVASIIYRQGKAKIFNVLETLEVDSCRLNASKRIVEDILTNIGRDAKELITGVLGDWKQEVEIDPDSILTGSEKEEAEKEYQEDEKRFR